MAKNVKSDMMEMWSSSHLNGGSAVWLESLYEDWLQDPASVDPRWRSWFESLADAVPGTLGLP